MPDPVYRILDASLNRAGEGIRTLEDYARFVLDHPTFSATAKRLRHDLSAAARAVTRLQLIQGRDTPHDVGTGISTSTEASRADVLDVLTAAIHRTQQALRCLEEYGKVIDPAFAGDVERIRYRFYTFAAELEKLSRSNRGDAGHRRRRRLSNGHLYALVEVADTEEAFVAQIRSLAGAGVDLFQLRDHGVCDRTLYTRSLIGSRVCREIDTLFIVNDRADIAVAASADGVHVGQDELPASVARELIGPDRLLGISTHDLQQAEQAVRDGADCIGCGPVFEGRTKLFCSYVGTTMIQTVVQADLGIPVFAIGGIDLDNLDQLLEVGCDRIAVTGAIRDAANPAAAARKLEQRLRQAIRNPATMR